MTYKVKSITLAKQGFRTLELARRDMPVVDAIQKRFTKQKPFKGLTLGACLHITKETGVLLQALQAGGAHIAVCASNPLSTQDDIAAALAKSGIKIYAWKGQTAKEYHKGMDWVLDHKPTMLVDDGADLASLVHTTRRDALKRVVAGLEQTTTGVVRLKAMAAENTLQYPVVVINDAATKHMFDNVYGTGQSTFDGILRATNTMIAGKTVVVAGYGYCGKGVAMRARGLGASVIVTEIDPLPALQAVMDGFPVMPMSSAASRGDIFITVTGNKYVIRKEHLQKMKDGVLLANAGHFDIEISLPDLKKVAKHVGEPRAYLEEFVRPNNKRIYLLASGRLVNLIAAEGHPSSVMDMSFANQALGAEWLNNHYRELSPDVYNVPQDIDLEIARLKLAAIGVTIDKPTEEQKLYMTGWQE